MRITVGNYTFEDHYTSIDKLKDRSGIYAIFF
jgi:hypothetical protein